MDLEPLILTSELSSAPSQKFSAVCLIISHLLTRLGDQMWEFAIPLILIFITPNSLLPPALFGLVIEAAGVIFSTTLGTYIDRNDRLRVARLGTMGQAISISISGFLLYVLVGIRVPEMASNIFHTKESTLLMVGLCISGSIGSLAARLMSIAVEKDWVPVVAKEESDLTLLNSRMRGIDLVTEVSGPAIAGVLLTIPNLEMIYGFIIIALFNFLTFFPQYILLRIVYVKLPELHTKILEPVEEQSRSFSTLFCGQWNPIATLVRSGSIFFRQPIALVVVAYAFLWLTVLSPHDPMFTAYLSTEAKFKSWELGVFRAVGAIFGVLSTITFPRVVNRLGLSSASMGYITWEGVMLLGCGAMIMISHMWAHARILFLVFIILSRFGLYGFGIGEMQFLQVGVSETIRGQMGSVENAFTSLATLTMYVFGIVASKPQNFIWLMWTSIACVNTGALVFFLWNCFWKYQFDYHGEEEHSDPHHLTLHNHEVSVNSDFVHKHVFFTRRWRNKKTNDK